MSRRKRPRRPRPSVYGGLQGTVHDLGFSDSGGGWRDTLGEVPSTESTASDQEGASTDQPSRGGRATSASLYIARPLLGTERAVEELSRRISNAQLVIDEERRQFVYPLHHRRSYQSSDHNRQTLDDVLPAISGGTEAIDVVFSSFEVIDRNKRFKRLIAVNALDTTSILRHEAQTAQMHMGESATNRHPYDYVRLADIPKTMPGLALDILEETMPKEVTMGPVQVFELP